MSAAIDVTTASVATRSVSVSARAAAVPWTIWLMFSGIATGLVGGSWDFAWHMSIGRERFWTMPHILVQAAAVQVAIACLYEILSRIGGSAAAARHDSIRVLGVHAPAGVFIALWGSLAMMASAPFDNWWHNAYGLDVQVITPPHGLLSLGWFATQIGTMVYLSSMIGRSDGVLRRRLVRLLLATASISVVLLTVMILPATIRLYMHSAACYLEVGLAIPAMVVAAGRASRHKWGCTIVGAGYTVIALAAEWLLPLVPARPKLGPVYHDVTHLIPLPFPLLLIAPAFVADLILQRLARQSSWRQALCVGTAFLATFFAVQWPFANFLMLPASRNWIFGTAYFSYFDKAGFQYDPNQFRIVETTTAAFVMTMVMALFSSIATTRLGLAWGSWMRRLCR